MGCSLGSKIDKTHIHFLRGVSLELDAFVINTIRQKRKRGPTCYCGAPGKYTRACWGCCSCRHYRCRHHHRSLPLFQDHHLLLFLRFLSQHPAPVSRPLLPPLSLSFSSAPALRHHCRQRIVRHACRSRQV